MSNASVIIDHEALRKFKGELAETMESLEENLRKTEQSMEEVAQTWKDIQFDKYKREFDKDKEIIRPLCKNFGAFRDDVIEPLRNDVQDYTEM